MASMEEEITKAFRVRRTVLEMLKDRGYSVDDSEFKMTRQEFISKFGENLKRDDLVMLKSKADDPSDQIYVFFPEGKKVGVPVIRALVNRLKSENVSSAIVVHQKALSPQAKAAVNEINSCFRMDLFEEAELTVNITDHVLVPKHTVLTNDEKKEILNQYRVKESQLPRILVNDPVARYYGLKRGQVVKITRQSETADTYDTYRYCT